MEFYDEKIKAPNLVFFTQKLKISLRMQTIRTVFRRTFAPMNITTFSTNPHFF